MNKNHDSRGQQVRPGGNKSLLTARDVQAYAPVSRTTAVQLIKQAGGGKDARGQWVVDARKFMALYNNPCRNSVARGGDIMKTDKIVDAIRKFAAGGKKADFFIQKRPGKKNWELRIHGGGRSIIISLRTPDKKIAKEIEATLHSRLQQAIKEGLIPRLTDEYLDEWLALKEKRIATSSYVRYANVVRKVRPFLPQEMCEVTSIHLEIYLDSLIKLGCQVRTYLFEFNVLNQAFKKAQRLGYISENPLDSFDKPKKPPTDVEPYTDEQLNAIFSEFARRAEQGHRKQSVEAWRVYLELFHCMNYTGMRMCDAISLQWECVDLNSSKIKLKQIKTGKDVHIRIPTEFKERLLNLAKGMKKLKGFVYTNTNCSPIQDSNLDSAIRNVMKACGFTKKSPIHSFRHTVAVRLLSAGMPIHEVANQLGDTVDTVVRNYIKPNAPAQDAVDAAYKGKRSHKGHTDSLKTVVSAQSMPTNVVPLDPQKSPQQKYFRKISLKSSEPLKWWYGESGI